MKQNETECFFCCFFFLLKRPKETSNNTVTDTAEEPQELEFLFQPTVNQAISITCKSNPWIFSWHREGYSFVANHKATTEGGCCEA